MLILGVAKTRFSHNDTPNEYAFHDLGAATVLITLQAAALGIATHQMAGFDRDKAREVFHIPETYTIGSVMTMGYQGDPSNLGEHYKGQEQSPRSRQTTERAGFIRMGPSSRPRLSPAGPNSVNTFVPPRSPFHS